MAKYILNRWQKPYFDPKLKIKIYADDIMGVLQGVHLKIVSNNTSLLLKMYFTCDFT